MFVTILTMMASNETRFFAVSIHPEDLDKSLLDDRREYQIANSTSLSHAMDHAFAYARFHGYEFSCRAEFEKVSMFLEEHDRPLSDEQKENVNFFITEIAEESNEEAR